MDLMVRINEGKLVKNVALDNNSDSSQVEEAKECLKSFSGRLDFKAPVLIGHSFGGATTLLNLSRDHRLGSQLMLATHASQLHKSYVCTDLALVF